MLDLNPGDRFAGCQIISMCGRGGYGTVYLAEDGVGRRVALKLVSTVDKRRELEGIRAYMKLASTSKHLLPIRHVGIERDELFYIMEPADPVPGLSFYLGDTLGKRLRQQGRLDPSQAIDIIRKTASAVRELHRAGFIHRDIKPGNIIFLHGEPVLSDPGLCCSAEQSVSLAGTLGFLPPECFFGEDVNSRQSDIFALGKCLYCAITGEAPGRFPRIPGDLDAAVCRKILPVLLKACNAKKEKRCADVDEFLRSLPTRLPPPSRWTKFKEAFRFWRLMHAVLWRTIVVSCLLAALLAAAGVHHYLKSRREHQLLLAESRKETDAFRKAVSTGGEVFRLQLEDALGEARGRGLFSSLSDLPAEPIASAEKCRGLRKTLAAAARRTAAQMRKTADPLRRVAAMQAFPDTPLGRFLEPADAETLRREMNDDARKNLPQNREAPQPGRTFYSDSSRAFEFFYVPPGKGISPTTGKTISIDYPFWVGSSWLTASGFSRLLRYVPLGVRDLSDPVSRFQWNDLIYACRVANGQFQIVAPFPPGYIVRPLTEDEWEYCFSRGARDERNGFDSDAARLFRNLNSPLREPVLSDRIERPDSYIIRGGADAKKKEPLLKKRIHVAFFQAFASTIGARLAIAPGDGGLYDREVRTGVPNHLIFGGKHYEFFGHIICSFSRSDAENLCRMLGGRLASLDSVELQNALFETSSPIAVYHVRVAADFKDGKWMWSSGKAVQNAPPAPRGKEAFFWEGNRFRLRAIARSLGFVCEWSETEWKNRRNWRHRIPPEMLVTSFRLEGKEYALLRFLCLPHLQRRFADILGGKLAEPEAPELRKKLAAKLADVCDKPVVLGGIWRNGGYYWLTGGRRINGQFVRKGEFIDNSVSSAVPALDSGGELCSIQITDLFLAEFPAAGSAR
ncbi:MAG: protein kinase [Lentisphaeria bacterium]|nr:protein kinase [Lentisphaeria bacterium]